MKLVLGLAGEIASGKGTVSKYIMEKYDGNSHRFSTVLREILQKVYVRESRENVQKISTVLRKNFSDDILSKIIFQQIKKDSHGIITIDGIRRPADMRHFQDLPGFRLVYIEADIKKRYQRVKKWGENVYDMNKTYADFKKDHEREADQHVKEMKDRADFIIDNNGTFAHLYKQADDIISEITKRK